MPPKVASDVWKYFTRSADKTSAKCKLCSTDLSYSGGTSNLRNHLKRHPESENVSNPSPAKKQTTMTAFTETAQKTLTTSHAERLTQSIADMIVSDYLPLSLVEGEGFKRMMALAVPNFTVPCRNTIRARIEKRYDGERAALIQELTDAKSAAITTDTWTSKSTESYITMTSHHITDDWELKSNVLLTRAMPERHTGENLATRLQESVEEFGLTGKVETCVHDNARNMECAGGMCEGWSDLGCFGHTLQLCIRPALEVPAISNALSRCRKLVGHFRHSTTLTAELNQRQQNNGKKPHVLMQDVPTRWNSTFDMVDRMVELRREITDVMLDNKITKKNDTALLLKDGEWDILRELSAVLSAFKDTTTYMCTERTVSASEIFPVVSGLLRGLSTNGADSSMVAKVKEILSEELIRRFKPTSEDSAKSVPMLASVLDPRYKKLLFLPNHLRKLTKDLLEARMDEAPLSIHRSDHEETPSKRPRLDFLVFSPENRSDEEELQQYLAERSSDVDPLTWWRSNEQRFPRVAYVAKRILAVPATSVPSERIFSSAGLIINKLRNRLSSEIVDKIVFLNKNC